MLILFRKQTVPMHDETKSNYDCEVELPGMTLPVVIIHHKNDCQILAQDVYIVECCLYVHDNMEASGIQSSTSRTILIRAWYPA